MKIIRKVNLDPQSFSWSQARRDSSWVLNYHRRLRPRFSGSWRFGLSWAHWIEGTMESKIFVWS
jgi:hypothetical protein